MFIRRVGFCVLVCLGMAGCSTLHLFGGSAAGVHVVGRSTYCGTPSQNSEVHYFPDSNAFQNWVEYRNISSFNRGMARQGVLIVEMGQRPTGGYSIHLDGDKTGLHGNTLQIGMDWHAPRLDAAVSQALTSECVAMTLPPGSYTKVKVVDQIGNSRGTVVVKPPSAH